MEALLDRREHLLGTLDALVNSELQPIRLPTARLGALGAAVRTPRLTFGERVYFRAGFRLGITAVFAFEFLLALWWRT